MPTALFFRPNEENLALSHGKRWLLDGIAEAQGRGYDVVDIVDNDCTYENLKNALETYPVDVAFLLGHGSPTHFTGRTVDGQEPIFSVCDGDEVMNGTISHFVSCMVGQDLLPDMVSKGAVYTVGYADTLDFMIEPPEAEEPFRDITVAIITAMLDGATLKEAWEAGISKGEEWIDRLWDSEESWASDAISLIEHDINCMTGLGDEEAYISPPTRLMAAKTGPLMVLGGLAWVILSG